MKHLPNICHCFTKNCQMLIKHLPNNDDADCDDDDDDYDGDGDDQDYDDDHHHDSDNNWSWQQCGWYLFTLKINC